MTYHSGMAHRAHSKSIPVIGVTGPPGAGKSVLSGLFRRWGAQVIDADKIGHDVVQSSPKLRARLVRAFGEEIVHKGTIDHRLLARRAFTSRAAVHKLNRIVHPALVRELKRQASCAAKRPRCKAVVIDAALLVEWGVGRVRWDYLVGVWAPYDLRLERMRERGISRTRLDEIARAQLPWPVKKTQCDEIIANDASLEVLRTRARLCWEKLLSSHSWDEHR